MKIWENKMDNLDLATRSAMVKKKVMKRRMMDKKKKSKKMMWYDNLKNSK
jgi:hypothetical protein